MFTPHEEQRAWERFEMEYLATKNARQAFHAAVVDLASRETPATQAARASSSEKPRLLLAHVKPMIEAICKDLGADIAVVCSFVRAQDQDTDARGVIVGILTNAGFSPREIAEGIGMSASAVGNLKMMRRSRKHWEPKILKFTALLG
jgi:hypothetical protein